MGLQASKIDDLGSSSDPSASAEEVAGLRARVAQLEAERDGVARARGDWASMLAHEMRTPLAVISGFARLLGDEIGEERAEGSSGFSDRAPTYVREILRANGRLERFVSDLLGACPRAETPFPTRREIDDLNAVVRTTLDSLAPILHDSDLCVDVKLATELDEQALSFDRLRIEQLITNLVANAVRHGAPGGRISVGTDLVSKGSPAASVRIQIDDDGPGIAACDRERIFGAYVKGSTESRSEGLGIGLTIVERIVRAHDGTIAVEDSELGGARFVVTLPFEPLDCAED